MAQVSAGCVISFELLKFYTQSWMTTSMHWFWHCCKCCWSFELDLYWFVRYLAGIRTYVVPSVGLFTGDTPRVLRPSSWGVDSERECTFSKMGDTPRPLDQSSELVCAFGLDPSSEYENSTSSIFGVWKYTFGVDPSSKCAERAVGPHSVILYNILRIGSRGSQILSS